MKYAVVTGCASGIGKDVAKLLKTNGVEVYGLDIQECYENYESYICEVSDELQVKKMFEIILRKTDHLDYLINCAGMLTIGTPLPIESMSVKQWDAILRINLRSVMLMTKTFHPLMKNSSMPIILNISSEQSFNPDKEFAPYAVSKAGINTFTKCCAKEFLDDKIRVNAIAFGTIKSRILNSYCNEEQEKKLYQVKEEQLPYGVISSETAAKIIVDLLDDKYGYMSGEVIRIDGGNHLCDVK